MKNSCHHLLKCLRIICLFAALCAPAGTRASLVAGWGDNSNGQTRPPNGLTTLRAVAAGDRHSLALKADGTVVAWGDNSAGATDVPAGLSGVTAIAANSDYSLALKSDGTAVAWGAYGLDFHLAGLSGVSAIAAGWYHWLALKSDGTIATYSVGNDNYSPTNVPPGLSNIIAVAAGIEDSAVLKADGTVVAWGWNAYGQTNVPAGLSNVIAIAAGYTHFLALKADGTVVAWGENSSGQSSVPPGLSNVVAVAGGAYHGLALKSDGTITAWGAHGAFPDSGQANVPAQLVGATAIAGGGYHSLALVFYGPIQILTDPQSQVLFRGSNATFSVSATGQAPLSYQWLANGQPLSDGGRISGASTAALTLSGVQPRDSATYSVVVSNAFGSVSSAGAVLTVVSPPFVLGQSPDQTVRAGTDVTLWVSADGTSPLTYQWWFNGTVLAGATTSALAFSNAQPVVSGTYTMLVSNLYGAVQTDILLTVTDSPPYLLTQPIAQTVPLGRHAAFSVSARGSLPLAYQWRFNGADLPGATQTALVLDGPALGYAQAGFYNAVVTNPFGEVISAKALLNVLGLAAWGDPVAVLTNFPTGLSNLTAIAAGGSHIVAVKPDGTVKAWMVNSGYLFTDAPAVTNVPPGLSNVVAVAAGRDHSLALRANGTVVAWGYNAYGQTNVPTGLSNVTAVAAGSSYSRALKADGTIVGWGSTTSPAVPARLSNIVAIAAGASHTLGLRRDGTVLAWGNGTPVLTNVPAGLSNVIAIAAGASHSLALKQDGKVVAWGVGSSDVTNVPSTLSNVVAVAGGSTLSLALRQDGTAVAWGTQGKNPLPPGLSNLVAIAGGGVQSGFGVALIANGSPWVTVQPVSQTVSKGTFVTFNARAAGVQPMSYQWQLNGQDLPGATNALLIITNAQGQDTGSYRMIAANAIGTATTAVATLTIPYSGTLAAALNATNLTWTTTPTNAPWFPQIRVTHDGDAAAQSGLVGNSQQSVLQTTATGPGSLTFWWKVSSEEGFDFLMFNLDSQSPVQPISGEVSWQQVTIAVPAGLHTFKWTYQKDASVSDGQDAGWVDQVVFTAAPVITQQPVSQTAWMGDQVTLQVAARGALPLTFQWLKGGTNLPGATGTALEVASARRSDSGSYSAMVSNPGGEVLSSNATLRVAVPQRFGPPLRLADGSLVFLSQDADGGQLSTANLASFEAQASVNLMDWTPLPGALTLNNGFLMLRDRDSANYPARFYRLVEH